MTVRAIRLGSEFEFSTMSFCCFTRHPQRYRITAEALLLGCRVELDINKMDEAALVLISFGLIGLTRSRFSA